MEYTLFSIADCQPIDTLEAHVLAQAYDAAWRALYSCEPAGQHVIEALGLAIEFAPRVSH
jgi:hypothetical protein